MGGGNSKTTETKNEARDTKPARAREMASSAPPVVRAEHRDSETLQRRGSMMPTQGAGKPPKVVSSLNTTHSAIRRTNSTVAKTKLLREKVGRLGQDDFDDDSDEVFNRSAPDPELVPDDAPASARFGRKQNQSTSAVVGNDAGGDLSQAAAKNLGGVLKRETSVVNETTVTGRRQRAFFNNDEELDEDPVKASSALVKAKQKAKQLGVQHELQRRQTARELGGTTTLSQTKSFTNNGSPTTEAPMTNGTAKVKQLLEQMKQFRSNMRAKRDMSDTDISDLHAQQEQYAKAKAYVAREVQGLGVRVDLLARQIKEQAVEFIDSIIAETDQRGGNVELVQTFTKHLVTVPWTAVCLEHDWVMTAAKDGSAKYLDALLQLPMLNDMEIQLDAVELLNVCAHHKSARIALSLVMMKHWSVLNVSALKSEMSPHWQALFVGVASHKRAIPNEDRSQRMSLLNKILNLGHMISIDFHAVDHTDQHSILQRCVLEGDTTLMSALVSNASDVNWNHIYSDGNTILGFAISQNHKLMVELLLGVRALDAFQFLPSCQGHALDLARKLKCHPSIIAAVEQKMKVAVPTNGDGNVASAPNQALAKKRAAAAVHVVPKLPEYITNPQSEHDTDDWILDTADRPVVATKEVCDLLHSLHLHKQMLQASKKDLLKSATAEARYFELEEQLPSLKRTVSERIMALGLRISVEGKDAKDLVIETVDDLMGDQEAENNTMLIRVLMYRVITVDFAPLITSQQWAVNALQAGAIDLLESLLKVHKLWTEEDVISLVNAAVTHSSKRIPLCNALLKHHDKLRLSTHATHLRASFQDLFDGITNPARTLPGEDRSLRQEVLYRLCSAKYITLQYEQEFTGSQTVFSRACRDGDIDLIRVMVDLRMLRDINRIHTNKSTALMQAVVGNQVEIVVFLASDPTVDVTVKSPHGTALELATKMRKDPTIIKALKDAGG
jgi:hypothetical protein